LIKTLKKTLPIILSLALWSCVSSKKFKELNANYQKIQSDDKNCNDALQKAKSENLDISKKLADMQTHNEYLKKNNSQVLGALQDMSVLSTKQAESVKESLESINKKDAYIMNLQSAIARKDSLNMILITNLKSGLKDVNDKDINIKVEKGVVYIDISDKLLFKSGKYVVTEKAKKVLGEVAQVLNAHPDIEIIVEGHTDNIPIHTSCIEDNWDLSVKRATSVVRILEKQYKINPARMAASGHSKYLPIEPNDTESGKALNRRTRIIVLPQLDQFFKLMIKK